MKRLLLGFALLLSPAARAQVAPTHLGIQANRMVTLLFEGGQWYHINERNVVYPQNSGTNYTPPPGYALMITDLDFRSVYTPANQPVAVQVWCQVPAPYPSTMTLTLIDRTLQTTDPNGAGYVRANWQEHYTRGLYVPAGTSFRLWSSGTYLDGRYAGYFTDRVVLQAYLIPAS